MDASIVDLRYNMKKVLSALKRNEEVRVLYRGALAGILKAPKQEQKMRVEEHPAFGLYKDDTRSVESIMSELRKERSHDV